MPLTSPLKLSICITTLNRASLIGATLDSILSQVTNECEIVVLDAASSDGTEQVVTDLARRFERLRYIKQEINNGIDRDYDRTVELARGEYCWLMTDDDLMNPGAVATVLDALRHDVSLLVVNAEAKDVTLSRVIQRRFIDVEGDRLYAQGDLDRLFVDVGEIFQYIGIVVIKRSIWLARERERYYGSLFVFLGVIFQEPLPGEARLLATPLISYRLGNVHTFSSNAFEVLMVNYPSFVWALPLSDWAKRKIVHSAEPWKRLHELLLWRGWDLYSMLEYRRLLQQRSRSILDTLTCIFVALLPGIVANSILLFYYSLARPRYRRVWAAELVLHGLENSRFYFRNWIFKRKSRIESKLSPKPETS